MNRTIGSSEIRWLTDPGTEFADSVPVAACRQIDVPLPEGIGCSSIRSIHLPLNVFVYAGTHRFTPPSRAN